MRALIVDGANVVGSRPDGWWRDRAGAARRLWERVVAADLPYDEVVVVLEGAAKKGVPSGRQVDVLTLHAAGSGDDAIVEAAETRAVAGWDVTVVTADRGLRRGSRPCRHACWVPPGCSTGSEPLSVIPGPRRWTRVGGAPEQHQRTHGQRPEQVRRHAEVGGVGPGLDPGQDQPPSPPRRGRHRPGLGGAVPRASGARCAPRSSEAVCRAWPNGTRIDIPQRQDRLAIRSVPSESTGEMSPKTLPSGSRR